MCVMHSLASVIAMDARDIAYWSIAVVLVVVAAAIVVTSVFAAYLWYTYRKYAHLPSPARPSFFLGHIPDLKGNNHPLHEIYYKWYEDAGPIFVVFFIIDVMVVTLNPDDVKELVTNPVLYGKPKRVYKHFQSVCGERALGTGLLSETEHEAWKPRRKLYNPVFHKSYLRSQLFKFNRCIDQLIKQLKTHADGQTLVPMKDYIYDITADIINQFAFSEDMSERWSGKTLGVRGCRVNKKLHYLTSHVLHGLQKTFRNPVMFEYLHPFEAASYREAVRALRRIGRDAILRRAAALEKQEPVPQDVLSCILKVSTLNNMDIEDLVDDFATFYAAGQGTTANMMCFALVLIHLHPEILERVQSEIEEVLGGKEYVSDIELKGLRYTEQVFMETLRLYPPISSLCKISPPGGTHLSGYFIPEGTFISMAGAVMCRMPQYFDSPDTFNPSRFDPENKERYPFVLFPFGLGQRSCIGRHFAMMEAKMVLARLLQTFKFTLPSNYRLVSVSQGFLETHDDIPCTLQVNQHNSHTL